MVLVSIGIQAIFLSVEITQYIYVCQHPLVMQCV